jgi:hypothetical protein
MGKMARIVPGDYIVFKPNSIKDKSCAVQENLKIFIFNVIKPPTFNTLPEV